MAIGIVAAVIFAVLAGTQIFHVAQMRAKPSGGVAEPHFTLTAADGRTVTEQDFRGKFLVVYFGYTFCPDVCPTNLNAIAAGLDKLGGKADLVVPVFVSVDPARDTPEKLSAYVAQFSPHMLGLSGTPEQVKAAATQFGAVYSRVEGDGEFYSVDHSADTYVVGPDGVRLETLAHGFTPERLAAVLSQRISSSALSMPPAKVEPSGSSQGEKQ
ncbi:MAG TPA: SCO family protein [Patescibacteria group bacterium]|nr:SCO family protein [Patescibacteria group bacterium]